MSGIQNNHENGESMTVSGNAQTIMSVLQSQLDKGREVIKKLQTSQKSKYQVHIQRYDDFVIEFLYRLEDALIQADTMSNEQSAMVELIVKTLLEFLHDGRLAHIVTVKDDAYHVSDSWLNQQIFFFKAYACVEKYFEEFLQQLRDSGITAFSQTRLYDFFELDQVDVQTQLQEKKRILSALYFCRLIQGDIISDLKKGFRDLQSRFTGFSMANDFEQKFLKGLTIFLFEFVYSEEFGQDYSFIYLLISYVNTHQDFLASLYHVKERKNAPPLSDAQKERLHNRIQQQIRKIILSMCMAPIFKELVKLLHESSLIDLLGNESHITTSNYDLSDLTIFSNEGEGNLSFVEVAESYESIAAQVQHIKDLTAQPVRIVEENSATNWKQLYEEAVAHQQVQNQQYQDQLRELAGQVESLQQENEQQQESIAQRDEEIAGKDKLLQQENELTQMFEEEVERLNEQLRSYDTQRVQIKIQQAQQETNSVRDELGLAHITIAELKQKLTGFRNQEETWQNYFAQVQEEHNTRLAELQSQIDELKDELQKRTDELEKERQKNQTLKEANESLFDRKQALSDKLKELEHQFNNAVIHEKEQSKVDQPSYVEIFQSVLEQWIQKAEDEILRREQVLATHTEKKYPIEERLDDLDELIAEIVEEDLPALQVATEKGTDRTLRSKLNQATQALEQVLKNLQDEQQKLFKPLNHWENEIIRLKAVLQGWYELLDVENLLLKKDLQFDSSGLSIPTKKQELLDLLVEILNPDQIKFLRNRNNN